MAKGSADLHLKPLGKKLRAGGDWISAWKLIIWVFGNINVFLSKHNNGIYYLYYNDAEGRRKKISTKAKLKNDVYACLSKFDLNEKINSQIKIRSITLKKNIFLIFLNIQKQFIVKIQLIHSNLLLIVYKITFEMVSSHHLHILKLKNSFNSKLKQSQSIKQERIK